MWGVFASSRLRIVGAIRLLDLAGIVVLAFGVCNNNRQSRGVGKRIAVDPEFSFVASSLIGMFSGERDQS